MSTRRTTRDRLEWTDLDTRAVDTIRVLAMDAVEKVGNGHPGTAMSLAPAAYLLWQRHLRHDPTDPHWAGRDRFVLSCGHTSLTLYIQLYLSGYGLTIDDLASFRTWESRTPGHPELHHTVGVETTTGPLGQGVGNAVGMAMASRRERGLFDPDTAPGESIFDHHIYCFASDGDMQEGVASESSSLAGHQQLANLILVWDHNQISIEDDTDIAFTEDVIKRYDAYGWHTQFVAVQDDGNVDVAAFDTALRAAQAETERPSFIALQSVIGWPAPKKKNTGAAHGSALGAEEVAATKEILGFDPTQTFVVADEVLTHAREVVTRGQEIHAAWTVTYNAWRAADDERAALYDRIAERRLPAGWTDALPSFPAGKDMATRKASGAVLSALAPVLPELWGGSADLAESNNTTMEGEQSFTPVEWQTSMWKGGPYGRTLHFGVREHAMGASMNGIALHGGTRVYGGTFLTFSDYMRPSVRLAALMGVPVTYVWTHDSIGLGEDGPTHQPIEHLAALRAIPGLDVVRPADANETVAAWRAILEHTDRPAGICLTRQNVPTVDRDVMASTDGVAKGAYTLIDASSGRPQVILMGSGSEVQIAVAAREQLEAEGITARVVSVPCMEWFEAQDGSYRDQVMPPDITARVSVEAGIAQPWHAYVGNLGRCISIERYGASAAYQIIYTELGITADAVVAAAKQSIAAGTR